MVFTIHRRSTRRCEIDSPRGAHHLLMRKMRNECPFVSHFHSKTAIRSLRLSARDNIWMEVEWRKGGFCRTKACFLMLSTGRDHKHLIAVSMSQQIAEVSREEKRREEERRGEKRRNNNPRPAFLGCLSVMFQTKAVIYQDRLGTNARKTNIIQKCRACFLLSGAAVRRATDCKAAEVIAPRNSSSYVTSESSFNSPRCCCCIWIHLSICGVRFHSFSDCRYWSQIESGAGSYLYELRHYDGGPMNR